MGSLDINKFPYFKKMTVERHWHYKDRFCITIEMDGSKYVKESQDSDNPLSEQDLFKGVRNHVVGLLKDKIEPSNIKMKPRGFFKNASLTIDVPAPCFGVVISLLSPLVTGPIRDQGRNAAAQNSTEPDEREAAEWWKQGQNIDVAGDAVEIMQPPSHANRVRQEEVKAPKTVSKSDMIDKLALILSNNEKFPNLQISPPKPNNGPLCKTLARAVINAVAKVDTGIIEELERFKVFKTAVDDVIKPYIKKDEQRRDKIASSIAWEVSELLIGVKFDSRGRCDFCISKCFPLNYFHAKSTGHDPIIFHYRPERRVCDCCER